MSYKIIGLSSRLFALLFQNRLTYEENSIFSNTKMKDITGETATFKDPEDQWSCKCSPEVVGVSRVDVTAQVVALPHCFPVKIMITIYKKIIIAVWLNLAILL